MATSVIDGIETRFEVIGSGPPLLMFSPGGFDAKLENWSTQGIYRQIEPVAHLSTRYSCIVFDRRESGESGGRVERITWAHYVSQGKGLLEHLGFEAAHLMGGCMGCPPAISFAVAHPKAVLSLTLFWPVGGARYRLRNDLRFAQHLAYVAEHGLDAVAALAQAEDLVFGKDARVGPWASVLRRDAAFREAYRAIDVERYLIIVAGIARSLVNHDSAPGADADELLSVAVPTLIVPGDDASHATSAARYLHECIDGSQYWDTQPDDQTRARTGDRLFEFLDYVR